MKIIKFILNNIVSLIDYPVKIRNRLRYFFYWLIYDIDKSFIFKGFETFLYGPGAIKLGKCSYIGSYSSINSIKLHSVIIGDYVKISHNVRIYTSTDVSDQDFSAKVIQKKTSNVIIMDYAWIGANVYIGPGVTIGRNAVIGANSVVTKSVADSEIWGGVPAKLIKKKNVQ